MHDFDPDISNQKGFTILNEVNVWAIPCPRVAPIGTSLGGEVEMDRSVTSELLAATDEVSVNVGLGDSCYAEIVFRRNLPVPLDISFRIDKESLACPLATDKVGILSEVRIEYLTE